MKTDLLAIGQVSHHFMLVFTLAEYRSFQRACLQPFVHLDEFWNFVRVFYPSDNPAVARNYRGHLITLALPRYSWHMYDIMPLLEFFNRAPHIECNIWQTGGEGDRIKIIANSLRQYIFAPPRGALTISKFMFRVYSTKRFYHGNLDEFHDIWHNAAFKIVFNPISQRDWMDGRLINFPEHHERAPTRMNKDRLKRQNVSQFLEAAGLSDDDIKTRWEMRFTVEGQR
ncbi:hypothetical protein G6011_06928 [Alternaria panax]|uniref:Uncharacterized protein n=1 Tax=Alternaria panax TaxID=48097 RepID=A0AAD4F9E3_9PLEO|nr:hypothetical protein G6011_06928 [Alternaria panax]